MEDSQNKISIKFQHLCSWGMNMFFLPKWHKRSQWFYYRVNTFVVKYFWKMPCFILIYSTLQAKVHLNYWKIVNPAKRKLNASVKLSQPGYFQTRETVSLNYFRIFPRSAQPPSPSPLNVWRRTTRLTSESRVSCCLWGPPSTWMEPLCMRRWQPSSLPRWTTWKWILGRSSPSGKTMRRIVDNANANAVINEKNQNVCVCFSSIQHYSNCRQYRSCRHPSGRPGHHGDCTDLCWTSYWWHHSHHCGWLVSVSGFMDQELVNSNAFWARDTSLCEVTLTYT